MCQKQLQDAFYKKAVLKNFAIFTGKHLCAIRPATLSKRDSNTGVSCEYSKIFKNICFEEHLRVAASVGSLGEGKCDFTLGGISTLR